ncbi:MAG: hypothetical protein ACYDAY_05515 [Candidatus Dormibacteria bacterium]
MIFLGVVLFSLLARPVHPSLAMLGAGLLAGKAIVLILAPVGWRLVTRTLAGYGLALTAASVAALLLHLR